MTTKPETDTPRTNEAVFLYGHPLREAVSADAMRNLERDLTAANAKLENLKKYASHAFGCPVVMTGAPDCYCGLEELLK